MIKKPLNAGFGRSGERYVVASFEKKEDKTYVVRFANGASEVFSPEEFIKYDLYAVEEVNPHTYADLRREVDFGRCRAVARKQAASSPKPSAAVARFVTRLGFSEETVNEVIAVLKEEGELDDPKVALRLAAVKAADGKASSEMIIMQLVSKGIDRETAENTVRGLELSDGETAVRIAEGRKRLGQDEAKVMRYLAGKGFSKRDIIEAVKKVYGNDAL